MNSLETSRNDESSDAILIKKLRERLSDLMSTNNLLEYDIHLYRWLLARNFNLDKTEAAIRKAIKWQEENEVKYGLDDETFLEFCEKFKMDVGLDKLGYPVIYMEVGGMDFKKAIATYGKKVYANFWLKRISVIEEQICNLVKETHLSSSKNVSDFKKYRETFITNVRGFSAFQLASFDVLKLTSETLYASGNYYPANFDRIIYINMNKVFKGVLKVLKPFIALSYRTLDIYGYEDEWKGKLSEILDEKELEKYLKSSAIEK